MKTKDELISAIIAEFDFERVHKVMKFLDWKWAGGSKPKVPTIHKLKECARSLLKDAYIGALKHKGERYSVTTGGFNADCFIDKGGNSIDFNLLFYIDEWSESTDMLEDCEDR